MTTAIVVEGGAMRGIFAAGVLDVFLEEKFHPFDLAVGSSAGACNLASHLAGQHGRNRRCLTTQMVRREFIDARRFARGGHWLDIDYLWDAFDREDPLDAAGATRGPTRFVVAATNVESGAPAFFEPDAENCNEVLRASSAVPVLYRKFVALGGTRYADGGVAAPIPADEAWRRGARRILVIRSRPIAFAGPSRVECVLAARLLHRQAPGLAHAFRTYRSVYQHARAFLADPPCEVIQVAPAGHLRTKRTTQDGAVLAADYARGREAGYAAIRDCAGW